jgi:hypothetical protein
MLQKIFNAPKDTSLWTGRGGIQQDIRSSLGISSNTNLIPIFEEVLKCIEHTVPYSGKRIFVNESLKGRKVLIAIDSPQAQIIADAIEDGWVVPALGEHNVGHFCPPPT